MSARRVPAIHGEPRRIGEPGTKRRIAILRAVAQKRIGALRRPQVAQNRVNVLAYSRPADAKPAGYITNRLAAPIPIPPDRVTNCHKVRVQACSATTTFAFSFPAGMVHDGTLSCIALARTIHGLDTSLGRTESRVSGP